MRIHSIKSGTNLSRVSGYACIISQRIPIKQQTTARRTRIEALASWLLDGRTATILLLIGKAEKVLPLRNLCRADFRLRSAHIKPFCPTTRVFPKRRNLRTASLDKPHTTQNIFERLERCVLYVTYEYRKMEITQTRRERSSERGDIVASAPPHASHSLMRICPS